SQRSSTSSTYCRWDPEKGAPVRICPASAGSSFATAASRCSRPGGGCRSCRRNQRIRLTGPGSWAVSTSRTIAVLPHDPYQLVDVDRFREVAVEAGLDEALAVAAHRLRGHRQHGDGGRAPLLS